MYSFKESSALSRIDAVRLIDRNRSTENHLMRPLDAPGEFQTLSGKVVVVLGNKVRTKKGFSSPCTSRVLYTHDVELDPEGLKFHVLFLNKPLQGGLDAPGDSDELTSAMIEKYVTMFKAHSELEGTLSGLSKFTRSILKICKQGQVSSVRPSFDQCIENAILRATRIIVRTISDASPRSRSRRRPSVTEAFEMQIQQVVECLVMRPIHDAVFEMVRKRMKKEDCEFYRAIDWHKCTSLSIYQSVRLFLKHVFNTRSQQNQNANLAYEKSLTAPRKGQKMN